MTNDDLLRDALRELAPSVPADDAALAGVERAVTRRRRRRAAGRVAAAVLAIALVTGGGLAVVRGGRSSEDGRLVTRPPLTTPDTTAPGTTTPHVVPAPDAIGPPRDTLAAGPVTIGDITFDVPDGWEAFGIDTGGDGSGETICAAPAGSTLPEWNGCPGVELVHADPLPGFEQGTYEDHGPWNWYHATDVAPCPDRPYEAGAPLDGVQTGPAGYDPIDSGERPVGDGTAVYDRWEARCERSGFTFRPRAWHLTEEHIVIYDIFGQPETEAILDSVRGNGG